MSCSRTQHLQLVGIEPTTSQSRVRCFTTAPKCSNLDIEKPRPWPWLKVRGMGLDGANKSFWTSVYHHTKSELNQQHFCDKKMNVLLIFWSVLLIVENVYVCIGVMGLVICTSSQNALHLYKVSWKYLNGFQVTKGTWNMTDKSRDRLGEKNNMSHHPVVGET